MKTTIIYHSHSGKTKKVIEEVMQALGASVTEVSPLKAYSVLSLIPGCFRALRGVADPVIPPVPDVSDSDLVVFASPVWAGRPSPVINGAIDQVSDCNGKKTFIIVTCNDAKSGNDALAPFRKRLVDKGCNVVGTAVLDKFHVADTATIADLVTDIRNAGTA